jgi:hypothetical protein
MQQTLRPSFSQLLDWKEGRLNRAQAREISLAISDADEDVRRDLAWLLLFDQVQSLTRLTSAPARTLKRIYETYEARAGRNEAPPGMVCQVARLRYDSAMTWAMASVRTGMPARGRQLVYSTESLDLALNFTPVESDQTFAVQGQVLQHQESAVPGYLISLEGEGQNGREAAADRFGEFSFEGVEPGSYRLFVAYDRNSIVVPEIQVTV